MWRHAAASEAYAPAVRREPRSGCAWMLWRQEHLAQYRFARRGTCSPRNNRQTHRRRFRKAHATLDTATSADATAKIATRARSENLTELFDLRSPAPPVERTRPQLHTALRDAETERLAFAMDLNDEGVCHRAAVTATDAYAKLYLAEANAVRRLVRAGYADAAAGCDRAAAEAWAEAPKRFAPGAADLIRLLSPP
ncbi:MAG: hypothetical protein H7A53_12920 [Akkermansiaceae bacterium]|nr:hypothetical protein [Akkermansiaceae bacterium]